MKLKLQGGCHAKGGSIAEKVAIRLRLNFIKFVDLPWYDVEELVEEEDMTYEMHELEQRDSMFCFCTSFNGQVDPNSVVLLILIPPIHWPCLGL